MKKLIKKIIAILYYNLLRRFQNQVGNRIILYHAIGTKLNFDTYGISISKEKFLKQILYLKENYEIIPIDSNYKNKLNKTTISITFDDGYKDNLYALEICEKYDIPFTLYITTGFIGQDNYLSIEDIQRFSNSKICIIGTHSVTHPHLDKLDYDEQYKELLDSKETLEKIVGYPITHFSYPHGSYNDDTRRIIEKIGYNMVSSSHISLNTIKNLDLKRLKRIEIIASDNISDLQKKILGYYDYLKYKE